MMITKYYAECAAGQYTGILESSRDSIRKNFEEMDLENVKLRDDMEKEIEHMEKTINKAIGRIESVTFR